MGTNERACESGFRLRHYGIWFRFELYGFTSGVPDTQYDIVKVTIR